MLRKTIAAVAIAAGLGAVVLVSGAQAAPPGGVVQSDYTHCSATANSGGFVTCPLGAPVDNITNDVKAFGTITSPIGGLPNLPNSLRVVGTTLNAAGRVTAVQWRVFGHQLVLDPNGNFRQNVYSGPIEIDQKVIAGGAAYCMANICS
jgi:hypothetical protein